MKYFGTDGIRGEAYQDLTLSLAYKLGCAVDTFNTEIIIGMDTRYSSIDLAKALMSGIKKNNVRFAGVIPTSGLMYYSLKHNVLAIMITASHNPYQDNGFKVIDCGCKLSEAKQSKLEELIDNNNEQYIDQKIDLKIDEEILKDYYCLLDKYYCKSKYKILFDAANGCYSQILKKYYSNHIINCKPDGFNINDKCGSTNVSQLIEKVKEKDYDYGFAFDGDGDRVILVDKFNRVYDGDFLVYLMAKNLKEEKLLQNNTIVLSEITNPGLLEKLTEIDIQYIITPVGDANIFKAMSNGYILGAEPSGHIINQLVLPFGDGLLNAFQIINILNHNEFSKEYNQINMFFSIKENLKYQSTKPLNMNLINKKIQKFNNQNRIVIVRKSGTEKVIRITLFQRYKSGIYKNLNKIKKRVMKCI